jgi:hypothetical protein
VVFLFLVGEVLEAYSVDRSRKAIFALASLLPRRALRLEGEEVREVPLGALRPGDRVRVPQGERVPADGVVLEGEAEVEEAAFTGEPLPQRRGVGERVYGGSLVVMGSLLLGVERPPSRASWPRWSAWPRRPFCASPRWSGWWTPSAAATPRPSSFWPSSGVGSCPFSWGVPPPPLPGPGPSPHRLSLRPGGLRARRHRRRGGPGGQAGGSLQGRWGFGAPGLGAPPGPGQDGDPHPGGAQAGLGGGPWGFPRPRLWPWRRRWGWG